MVLYTRFPAYRPPAATIGGAWGLTTCASLRESRGLGRLRVHGMDGGTVGGVRDCEIELEGSVGSCEDGCAYRMALEGGGGKIGVLPWDTGR